MSTLISGWPKERGFSIQSLGVDVDADESWTEQLPPYQHGWADRKFLAFFGGRQQQYCEEKRSMGYEPNHRAKDEPCTE